MRFRKRRPDEEIGRRRPVSAEQGQSRVFSYYASRSTNDTNVGRSVQQEAAPARHPGGWQAFLHRMPLFVSGAIVLVTVISQLGLSASPKVVVLSGDGGNLFLHNTAVYQQAAAKLFSKSLGNRNKLTVDAAGISRSLKSQFPELSDVSITLPVLGSRPVVYVQPFEPSFILTAGNGKFVLDSTGRALASADNLPQLAAAHLPYITDESGLQPHTGSVALPGSNIAFMQTVLAQLRAGHFNVRRIVLPPAASEVDVYIGGKPYYVKFNLQDQNGALQQVGTFIAVAQHLESRGALPAHYIDVRVDGRAYYK
jgi:cell division septal protein FtsQ